MARKKKEFNKNGTFQKRFTDLWYKSGKTQEQLAKALGVTRPTVVGWSDGRNLPDIESLERITKLFGVSADYLLGLSDTVSPDVSLRAAVEYTGLSEAAVEWLHIGLDDFTIKYNGVELSDEKKKENWEVASALIKDPSFSDMIYHLKVISREAYWGKILEILCKKYAEFEVFGEHSSPQYSPKENRDIVEANYTNILTAREPRETEEIRRRVAGLDDLALSLEVYKERFSTEERNDLHQFQAAKAFNRFMDQLLKESVLKAEQRFAQPET